MRKRKNVFTWLGEMEKDVFSRLRPENTPRHRHVSAKTHASVGRTARDPDLRKGEARNLVRTEEEHLSENENDRGGHWKSKSKNPKSTTDEEGLYQPWLCEATDPFTPRIHNIEFPKRIRMLGNVKTYDGSGDPEDHLKIFQRWAMPTWCHMFNSTQLGFAKLWFDELPPESIYSYVEL
ncbi:hypothetical protein Tco_1149208 [Tanacetum coccineum]